MAGSIDLWEQEAARRAAAVAHVEGPLLVTAGAGGGKTGILVDRAVRLIRDGGVPPEQVWVVAFTGQAVGEFAQRLRRELGDPTPRVSTVHRAALQVLREYDGTWFADQGLTPAFRLVGDTAALSHFTQLLLHLELTKGADEGAVFRLFEWLESERLSEADAAPRPDSPLRPAYDAYVARLRRENGVDLTEIVALAAALLEAVPAVRERVQVRYLLVDEAQDLNPAQLRFLQLLADPEQNVSFVGDLRQSIFGWQGADPGLLARLPHGEAPATTITLQANHRSTVAIIRAAEAAIGAQAALHPPQWPSREEGTPVRVVPSSNAEIEARRVAQWLTSRQQEGVAWSAMAVLARTHARLATIEEALLREGIPYQAARTSFFDRPSVREPMTFLRHLAGEPEALRDLLRQAPWGIPAAHLAAIEALSGARGVPLRQLLGEAATLPLPQLTRVRLGALHRILTRLEGPRKRYDRQALSLLQTLEGVLRETGLEAWLALQQDGNRPDGNPARDLKFLRKLIVARFQDPERLALLVQLARSVRAPDPLDLKASLDVALDARTAPENHEAVEEEATERDRGGVQLLTLHQSKGSEFPAVAILGCEALGRQHGQSGEAEGQHRRASDRSGARIAPGAAEADLDEFVSLVEAWELAHERDPEECEREERRLLYVGMTRARDHLALFWVGTQGRVPPLLQEVTAVLRAGGR